MASTKVQQHGENHDIPNEHQVSRPGAWLPTDSRTHHEWLGEQVKNAHKHRKELIPVLQEFKEFIESTPRVYMYFTAMFEEVPYKHIYRKDPTGRKQIRDYKHMLEVLNHVFGSAPVWTDSAQAVGMVGVPMCAILDYPMSTPSGHAAFLDPEVNKMLKKVLNEWGKFLMTPESAGVLHEGKTGWFGETGTSDMMAVANGPYKSNYKFEDFFVCDTSKKHSVTLRGTTSSPDTSRMKSVLSTAPTTTMSSTTPVRARLSRSRRVQSSETSSGSRASLTVSPTCSPTTA